MLFGKKPKKEKIIITEDDLVRGTEHEALPTTNPYYSAVSYRYRIAKYATLTVLVFFILISITLNRENITYSNFIFLVKDMNTVFESDGVLNVLKNVSYNTDKNQKFALYRNGLAVAGNSNIYIYNSAGKQTYSGQLQYSSPHISSSDKYMLVYDLGSLDYSVYNSFAKLHTDELDFPIIKARISDSGVYAVVCEDIKHNSVITVYNKNFAEIEKRSYKDNYIMDVALSEDGTLLAVVSAGTENGEYFTEISVSEIGTAESISRERYTGLFPVSVDFGLDSDFSVVCDKAVLFFSQDGRLLKRFDYGSEKLSRAANDMGVTTLLLSNYDSENENRLIVFDSGGDIIYDGRLSGKVNDLECYFGEVYLLYDTEVKKIVSESAETQTVGISPGAKDMITVNKNTVLLCYSSHADYVEIN